MQGGAIDRICVLSYEQFSYNILRILLLSNCRNNYVIVYSIPTFNPFSKIHVSCVERGFQFNNFSKECEALAESLIAFSVTVNKFSIEISTRYSRMQCKGQVQYNHTIKMNVVCHLNLRKSCRFDYRTCTKLKLCRRWQARRKGTHFTASITICRA